MLSFFKLGLTQHISRFIHIIAFISTSFLLLPYSIALYRLYSGTYAPLLCLYLNCFQFFMLYKVTLNIYVQVFAQTYVLTSHKYKPRTEISGSFDNYMFTFFKNCQAVFENSCSMLHFYQQYKRVPISLHPCQHLLLLVFLVIAIFASVMCMDGYLIVVLICVSLINNDI